ncbi:MAG: glycosyltransferase family 4 protein [Chloroflexi bacterium]|nr:glycosyltransferase family 4 protein [Chloroflexota bacterium]
MPGEAPKLLYVVNIPRFFLSHRMSLALAARQRGYDVQVATSLQDSDSVERIRDQNLRLHPIPLSQHGMNPLVELRTINALRRLYSGLKPDLIHHISIKPVLYGGIAARLTRQRAIIHAMSGLGYVFASRERRASLLRQVTRPLFRAVTGCAHNRMIFQNADDRQFFLKHGMISSEKAVLIRGSGVDEKLFTAQAETLDELPVVLFAGRLLWQKGIGEFVEVARRLRGRARFRVVGYEEATSPLNVSAARLYAWADEGLIEWLGKRDDMPQVYAESNIVCLPSTYGEGVPKVLIEAAACGRACVTTDTPGCREIVRHGENGLLVPPEDVDALAAAVERLIRDPALRQEMGAKGRQVVLGDFTLRQVIDETLELYKELLDAGGYSWS